MKTHVTVMMKHQMEYGDLLPDLTQKLKRSVVPGTILTCIVAHSGGLEVCRAVYNYARLGK